MNPVTTTRPRIWLTPARVTALQAQAQAGDPRWQPVLNAANVNPADWNSGIMNYSLAYVVTGSIVYAQRAWTLMAQSMQAGLGQITPDSGYQARNYLPASAVVYDWLNPWLGAAQKAQLQADMEACADWVWPETNPSRNGAWGVNAPGSNYYQAFMFTWLTGLALAGVSAKAQGYIDNARRRWDTEVVPYLNTLGQGGVFQEGFGYGVGSTGFLMWYLQANLSATGEDLFAKTPWTTDAVTAMAQFANPVRRELAPIGDLSAGPINDYGRRVMLVQSVRDARCNPWLNTITPNHNLQQLTQWEEFTFYTVVTPTPALDTCYMAPGTGIVSSRTDASAAGTQLLFVAGPTTESHQDRAQGAFFLFRDVWQAATAKLGSHSGLDQDCWDYCCLTVTLGKVQSQTWTQDTVRMLATEDTPAYTCLKADLTGAYPGLTAYTRELFFLKQGSYLMVRDVYTPQSPAAVVNTNISTPQSPQPDGPGAFRAGSLFGLAVSPLNANISLAPVQNDPKDVTTYRVWYPGGAAHEIMLALEAGAPGQTARTIQQGVYGNGVSGALLGANSFVGWAQSGTPWTFSLPGATQCWLLGLKPNTSYTLNTGAAVTSTAAGVLSFTAGPGLVTITEGTGPPVPPPVTLTGCSPNPAVSGQQVLLTGTGFSTVMRLKWGSNPILTFVLSGSTQVAFTAPTVTFPTTNVLSITVGGGPLVAGPALTVNPVPVPPSPNRTFTVTIPPVGGAPATIVEQ